MTDKVTIVGRAEVETLRDKFAMAAMQGMNASPELLEVVTRTSIMDGSAFEALARSAYRQADAMMAERAKTNEKKNG